MFYYFELFNLYTYNGLQSSTVFSSMKVRASLLMVIFIGLCACTDKAQLADPDFIPRATAPYFSVNNSPVVMIDESHNNFLTMDGRYKPFAQVLRSDGFKVIANTKYFALDKLQQADILVIANALDRSRRDWSPPYGYALNEQEVLAVKQWVIQGGALFLLADHTPLPKVIENLALAFGFEFTNGHVDTAVFKLTNNTLAKHPITQTVSNKALPAHYITQIKSFGGSAFKPPEQAISLLTLGKGAISVEPAIPFQIKSNTPRVLVQGWSQGAVMPYGRGRLAVFAEGMMFSSQLDTKSGKKYGLRSKGAEQNEAFLLSVMHWLAGEKLGQQSQ